MEAIKVYFEELYHNYSVGVKKNTIKSSAKYPGSGPRHEFGASKGRLYDS